MISHTARPATEALSSNSMGIIDIATESLSVEAEASGGDILLTALIIGTVALSGILVLFARRL